MCRAPGWRGRAEPGPGRGERATWTPGSPRWASAASIETQVRNTASTSRSASSRAADASGACVPTTARRRRPDGERHRGARSRPRRSGSRAVSCELRPGCHRGVMPFANWEPWRRRPDRDGSVAQQLDDDPGPRSAVLSRMPGCDPAPRSPARTKRGAPRPSQGSMLWRRGGRRVPASAGAFFRALPNRLARSPGPSPRSAGRKGALTPEILMAHPRGTFSPGRRRREQRAQRTARTQRRHALDRSRSPDRRAKKLRRAAEPPGEGRVPGPARFLRHSLRPRWLREARPGPAGARNTWSRVVAVAFAPLPETAVRDGGVGPREQPARRTSIEPGHPAAPWAAWAPRRPLQPVAASERAAAVLEHPVPSLPPRCAFLRLADRGSAIRRTSGRCRRQEPAEVRAAMASTAPAPRADPSIPLAARDGRWPRAGPGGPPSP
jgi:hypothetical protein